MPKLENPKHEAFALQLARGHTQKKAYALAGYIDNSSSSASRLASAPDVQNRVEEIKEELTRTVNTIAKTNGDIAEIGETLAEMGLTPQWVAHAYKTIYDKAIDTNQLAPANTAVANIQKLIDSERVNVDEAEGAPKALTNLSEATALLGAVLDIVKMTKGDPDEFEKGLVDITPIPDMPKDIEDVE